jgi:hypothetical protein
VGSGGAEAAAVLECLPTEAIEVVVELALSVVALFEAQWLSAATTEDGALEVVMVGSGLLAALSSASRMRCTSANSFSSMRAGCLPGYSIPSNVTTPT